MDDILKAALSLPWSEGEPLTAGKLRRFVRGLDKLRVSNDAKADVKLPGFLDGDDSYEIAVEWRVEK